MSRLLSIIFVSGIFFVLSLFVSPFTASAHCDCIDGPVVSAARKALDSQNPNYVLIWVKPEDENKIKKALKRALARKKSAKTDKDKDEVDMEFFQTLIKVHREGEGVAYEGVKPAGSIGKEVALADMAIESKILDDVLRHISSDENRKIIQHLFKRFLLHSEYHVDDVSAGRQYVKSYVEFIHAAENAMKGADLGSHHHD